MPNMTDNIVRFRVVWTGFKGGPGLSTFYTSADPSVVADANGFIKTFFEAIKTHLCQGMFITFPSVVDSLDSVTGNVTGSQAVSPLTQTSGTPAGIYAGGVGAQVRWHTDGTTTAIKPPHGIRTVVGSTFLGPISSGTFDSDGTLDNGAVASMSSAAQAMVSSFANNLRIWTKPVLASDKTTVLRPGHNSPVLGATILDQVAFLKSRRT